MNFHNYKNSFYQACSLHHPSTVTRYMSPAVLMIGKTALKKIKIKSRQTFNLISSFRSVFWVIFFFWSPLKKTVSQHIYPILIVFQLKIIFENIFISENLIRPTIWINNWSNPQNKWANTYLRVGTMTTFETVPLQCSIANDLVQWLHLPGSMMTSRAIRRIQTKPNQATWLKKPSQQEGTKLLRQLFHGHFHCHYARSSESLQEESSTAVWKILLKSIANRQ